MQIALQDLRSWGNKKMASAFMENGVFTFNDKLLKLDYYGNNIKSSSFSIADMWSDLKVDFPIEEYKGFYEYIYYCQPLIDHIEIDDIVKRRFRNIWVRIWSNFTKDLDLSEQEKNLFMSVAIRIVDSIKDPCVNESEYSEILKLFNGVLIYSILISSINVLNSYNLSCCQVIEKLILLSPLQFIDWLMNIKKY